MKLKTIEIDGKTYAVIEDGKPVYIHDDGKEVAFDAPATVAKIGQLNGEARNHREAKEAAETKLKAFEGIDDPAAARDALNTVANLDAKKLVDAGKVEEVKAAAIKATEEKFAPVVAERDKLKNDYHAEMIGGRFARSKYIADSLAIPADMVEARFGRNFEIVDGKVVAKDASGNQIYSVAKPGDLADFDEALEILVGAYPQRDHILKGSGDGSGALGKGGAAGSGKTMTREAFDTLSPAEKSAKMAEGITLTDAT